MFKITSSLSYVILNYMAYVLMFINALLIGKFVSVRIFGIYSFILLVNQYLYYISVGTPYSFGTLAIEKKHNSRLVGVILGNSIIVNLSISLAVSLFLFALLPLYQSILIKYSIAEFFLFLVTGALATNFNNLFLQLFRVYGKFFAINVSQILSPLLILSFIVIKNKEMAPADITIAYTIGPILSLLLFCYELPIKPIFKINVTIIKLLICRGVYLLTYNMAFAFILTSAATIVSMYFSVSDFAQYKFAQNISSAIVMITSAFTFLVYPKVLNRFIASKVPSVEIDKYRKIYTGSFNVVSILFISAIPLIMTLFEEFIPMIPTLSLLIVAKIFTNQTSLYSILFIAKKEEKKLCLYSIIAVKIVVIFSLVSVYWGSKIEYIGASVALSSMIYYFLVIFGITKFDNSLKATNIMKKDFNYSMLLPIILISLIPITHSYVSLPLIILLAYFILNVNTITSIIKFAYYIQKDESKLDF